VRYLPPFTARDRYLGMERVVPPMATGVMRGARSSEARAVDPPSRPPSLPTATETPSLVSLRPLKDLVRKLSPSHPLRILLMGEPDAMPVIEFTSKICGWLRLLPRDG
jgi:hypothetical protein